MLSARQDDFFDLIEDLQATGPIQKGWKKFSPLNDKKTEFHCHLDYEAFAMRLVFGFFRQFSCSVLKKRCF